VAGFGVYRFGLGGPAAQWLAETLPLPAGRVGDSTVLLRDLYGQATIQTLGRVPRAAGRRTGFTNVELHEAFDVLVDTSLIRAELSRDGTPVTEREVAEVMQHLAQQSGSAELLERAVRSAYATDPGTFRQRIVRPTLEAQRLAVKLMGNQSRYAAAWQEARNTASRTGSEGLPEVGWVSAAELQPPLSDVVASLAPNVRSQPFITPDGLSVMLVTESAKDAAGATRWHLWQKVVAADALGDFLKEARATTRVRYYLP
jgi:hypothetical protein